MGVVASGSLLTPQRLSIPAGRVSVSLAAAASTTVNVGFGFTFPAAPRVGTEIGTAPAAVAAKVTAVTTTGFTLQLYTVTGAAITANAVPVDWWAIPA